MNEILEFLNARVEFLRSFGSDEIDDELIDGEEIYNRGIEEGRYSEAVFLRKKVKEMASKLKL